MLRFRKMKTLEAFTAVHGTVHNHSNQERHRVSRQTYKERRSAALLGDAQSRESPAEGLGELRVT